MVILHHLLTGGAKLEMQVDGKERFFVPLMLLLKVLSDFSDSAIFQQIIKGRENDAYFLE